MPQGPPPYPRAHPTLASLPGAPHSIVPGLKPLSATEDWQCCHDLKWHSCSHCKAVLIIFPARQDHKDSLKPLRQCLARVDPLMPSLRSQPELSTGVRAATAPLPQARLSSAQESAALPEPEQALDNPFSPSPFASISAQKPGCLPLQEDFKLSALFQPSGGLTALAENTSGRFTGNPLGTALPQRHSSSPGPGAQAGGAAALHTARSPSAPQPRGAPAPKAQLGGPAYEPKQLPPCSPSPASRSTSQLLLTTAVGSAHHIHSSPWAASSVHITLPVFAGAAIPAHWESKKTGRPLRCMGPRIRSSYGNTEIPGV